MSTYNHQQVLSDYATGKITPEMAVGHSLQHIDKLYAAQNTANANWHALQSKVDALEKRFAALQTTVDRLTAFMAKLRPKRKQKPSGE
jgi:hypothetical protein